MRKVITNRLFLIKMLCRCVKAEVSLNVKHLSKDRSDFSLNRFVQSIAQKHRSHFRSLTPHVCNSAVVRRCAPCCLHNTTTAGEKILKINRGLFFISIKSYPDKFVP